MIRNEKEFVVVEVPTLVVPHSVQCTPVPVKDNGSWAGDEGLPIETLLQDELQAAMGVEEAVPLCFENLLSDCKYEGSEAAHMLLRLESERLRKRLGEAESHIALLYSRHAALEAAMQDTLLKGFGKRPPRRAHFADEVGADLVEMREPQSTAGMVPQGDGDQSLRAECEAEQLERRDYPYDVSALIFKGADGLNLATPISWTQSSYTGLFTFGAKVSDEEDLQEPAPPAPFAWQDDGSAVGRAANDVVPSESELSQELGADNDSQVGAGRRHRFNFGQSLTPLRDLSPQECQEITTAAWNRCESCGRRWGPWRSVAFHRRDNTYEIKMVTNFWHDPPYYGEWLLCEYCAPDYVAG